MTTTTWADLITPGAAEDFFQPRPAQPFNPASHDFDVHNARGLAELCRLVYRDDDRARFLDRAGLSELLFVRSEERTLWTDTQGYVVGPGTGEWAALIFRGSSSPADWLTNARFALGPW